VPFQPRLPSYPPHCQSCAGEPVYPANGVPTYLCPNPERILHGCNPVGQGVAGVRGLLKFTLCDELSLWDGEQFAAPLQWFLCVTKDDITWNFTDNQPVIPQVYAAPAAFQNVVVGAGDVAKSKSRGGS
jgi:hypothetical protein